jgi:hypothetical protein
MVVVLLLLQLFRVHLQDVATQLQIVLQVLLLLSWEQPS